MLLEVFVNMFIYAWDECGLALYLRHDSDVSSVSHGFRKLSVIAWARTNLSHSSVAGGRLRLLLVCCARNEAQGKPLLRAQIGSASVV